MEVIQEVFQNFEPILKTLTDDFVDMSTGWKVNLRETKGLFIFNPTLKSADIEWSGLGMVYPLPGLSNVDWPLVGVLKSAKNTVPGQVAQLLMVYRW